MKHECFSSQNTEPCDNNEERMEGKANKSTAPHDTTFTQSHTVYGFLTREYLKRVNPTDAHMCVALPEYTHTQCNLNHNTILPTILPTIVHYCEWANGCGQMAVGKWLWPTQYDVPQIVVFIESQAGWHCMTITTVNLLVYYKNEIHKWRHVTN